MARAHQRFFWISRKVGNPKHMYFVEADACVRDQKDIDIVIRQPIVHISNFSIAADLLRGCASDRDARWEFAVVTHSSRSAKQLSHTTFVGESVVVSLTCVPPVIATDDIDALDTAIEMATARRRVKRRVTGKQQDPPNSDDDEADRSASSGSAPGSPECVVGEPTPAPKRPAVPVKSFFATRLCVPALDIDHPDRCNI